MSFVNLGKNHISLSVKGVVIYNDRYKNLKFPLFLTWPSSHRIRWPFARNRSPIGEVVSGMTMLMSKVTEVKE